jgi:cytochrome c-type biogenesis protein CcmH/NrfG
MGLGEPKMAREQLEVAYTIKPLDNTVLELLATAMLQSEDFDAMSTELRRLAEDRNGVSEWMRYGTFLQKAGDFDTAETALKTAARLDRGQRVEPQLALASLYRDAGDDKKAVARLKNALYLAPDDPDIMSALRSYGEIPGPTLATVPPER